MWRHGAENKSIPLLDDKSTFLTASDGDISWVGTNLKCAVNNCQSETCKHVQDIIYDSVFCECSLCNTNFWQPYKALFNGDGCPTPTSTLVQMLAVRSKGHKKAQNSVMPVFTLPSLVSLLMLICDLQVQSRPYFWAGLCDRLFFLPADT